MTHSRGIQTLSEQIGVEPDHVAHALRLASRTFAAIQTTHFGDMTADQFRRLIGSDRHAVAIVANLAMRFAGRIEDAQLLMDIYKASSGTARHRPVIRKGVGTLPEYHDHAYVQQAIHILEPPTCRPSTPTAPTNCAPASRSCPAATTCPAGSSSRPTQTPRPAPASPAADSATSPSCAGPDGASSPNPSPTPACGPSATPTTGTTPSPPDPPAPGPAHQRAGSGRTERPPAP